MERYIQINRYRILMALFGIMPLAVEYFTEFNINRGVLGLIAILGIFISYRLDPSIKKTRGYTIFFIAAILILLVLTLLK